MAKESIQLTMKYNRENNYVHVYQIQSKSNLTIEIETNIHDKMQNNITPGQEEKEEQEKKILTEQQ